MANTFVKIASVTVGAGGASSIDFTSIPATYTDLCVELSLRDGTSAQSVNGNIIFNSNTSAIYSSRRLYATGSGAGSDSFSGLTSMPGIWINSATSTSNTFANIMIYIPNYAGSTNKSVSIDSVTENNATVAYSGLTAALFASTAAITSFGISTGSNFVQYSTATLYGIKNS
jgi:hypothetical protein